MFKTKKLLLCIILAAIACALASLAACNLFARKKEAPPQDFTVGEVTDTSIEICGWLDANGERGPIEFSIDNRNYYRSQDGYVFSGLISNTEYTLYARIPGWQRDASDPITKTVKTLRSQNPGLPQADYTQERGKITLTGCTQETEASFDGGLTYSDEKEHTYTVKGRYEILVRYKQTDRAFASESVALTVEYSDFFAGLGTEERPYLVTSFDELRRLNDKNNFYRLENDITFPAEEINSIIFTGTLDGNGKKFISPKVNGAVFGGKISAKDLTVENAVSASVYGGESRNAGILAYEAQTLENVSVSGEVYVTSEGSGNAYIGGICGSIPYQGKIINCSADVKLRFESKTADGKRILAGGIVGFCYGSGEVFGCTAKTDFKSAGGGADVFAGGIAGSKGDVVLTRCSAYVNFNVAARDMNLGGIAGGVNDTDASDGGEAAVKNCFASGEIVALNSGENENYGYCNIGGILGGPFANSTCSIEKCVSAADISVNGTGLSVNCGGVIGLARSILETERRVVKDCLYTGNIAVNLDGTERNSLNAIIGRRYFGREDAENCFIKVQPSHDVNVDGATAVQESVYLTAAWQRENLMPDETVWTITDGELPALSF